MKLKQYFFQIVLLLLVSACSSGGGGGGGSSSGSPSNPNLPTAASLTVNADLKQLEFNWSPVSNADYYKLMENPDGVSGFVQVGGDITNTFEVVDIAVHRVNWSNARYLLQSCNSFGCTDSNEVNLMNSVAAAIGYFKASNTGGPEGYTEGDNFGSTVAVSVDGNTIAVAAIAESSNATGIDGNEVDNSADFAGAVYIFYRDQRGWYQQAYIKASNTDSDDKFGSSLALSADGNKLIVGSPNEDSSATGFGGNQADNAVSDSGAVYVFSRTGVSWQQDSYIKASNSASGFHFGESVALDETGNIFIVGAPGASSSAGSTYVFNKASGNWVEQAILEAQHPDAGDSFGNSVDISADGNTIAVGAKNESSDARTVNGDATNNLAEKSGAVYVFTQSNQMWNQQSYIKASNSEGGSGLGATGDNFGTTVTLSSTGDILAVGAPREDSNATGINGNEDDNSAPDSGAIYVFQRDVSNWQQQAYIKASNTNSTDYFGDALAISADGNTLAVGARLELNTYTGNDIVQNAIQIYLSKDEYDRIFNATGAVYVFNHGVGGWNQDAYLKSPNAGPGDWFGSSVAISEFGDTLVAGATGEDSSATGINGDQTDNGAPGSGAMYLY